MNRYYLRTKRPWNWKVFLILAGSITLAAFLIVPYSLHQLQAYDQTSVPAPGWGTVVVNGLINSLIVTLIGGIGLLIANRIGTGLPIIENWVARKSSPISLRKLLAVGLMAGVGLAAAYWLLQDLVFGPPMAALFEEIGYVLPDDALTPPLYGLLAAISAGITEETIFRLFGLSALAWLGGFAFHDSDRRPALAAFWIANIVFALAFGFMHLPDAASRGWPINGLIITRTVIVNGVSGLVLGWLYWSFGLETAMLAHFWGDAILYAVIPFVIIQESGAVRIAAVVGAVICILLALAWAWKSLILEKRLNQADYLEEFPPDSISSKMQS
jgi:membrane protease YdiL (CAAX protease family)